MISLAPSGVAGLDLGQCQGCVWDADGARDAPGDTKAGTRCAEGDMETPRQGHGVQKGMLRARG